MKRDPEPPPHPDRSCLACGAARNHHGIVPRCPACGLAGPTATMDDTPDARQARNLPRAPDRWYQPLPEGRIVLRAPWGKDGEAPGCPLAGRAMDRTFGAMILIRHLEHSFNPATELDTARRLLTPGALLVLEIGAPSLSGTRWQIPVRAARRLLENAGFAVVRRVGRFSLKRHAPLRLVCRRYAASAADSAASTTTEDQFPAGRGSRS